MESRPEFLRDEVQAALDQTQEGVIRIAKIVRAMRDFGESGRADEKKPLSVNRAIEDERHIGKVLVVTARAFVEGETLSSDI